MKKWLIPLTIGAVMLGLTLGGCSTMDKHDSEYKYNHPDSLGVYEQDDVEKQLAHDGDTLVSRLGSFEDEYNLIHSLVFKFMNQVIKEFPSRVLETNNVDRHNSTGEFKRGKLYSDNTVRSLYASENGYTIGIEDISSPETIQRFWEIAKSIFEPAGFQGGDWLPPRKLSSGYTNFDWVFVKPSGISDPHISWKNESTIEVGGEKALVVNFTTDTRLYKSDLAKYRAASASTTPTVTNQP